MEELTLPLDLPMQSHPPPRPRITARTYHAAAKALLPEVIEWLRQGECGGRNEHDIEQDLVDAMRSCCDLDGFKIARRLDDKGWECNSDLVEILTGAQSALTCAHDDEVREWVAANNIKPALSVGEIVETPDGIGPISKIYADRACYVVKTEEFLKRLPDQAKHDGVGTVLAFEECKLARTTQTSAGD